MGTHTQKWTNTQLHPQHRNMCEHTTDTDKMGACTLQFPIHFWSHYRCMQQFDEWAPKGLFVHFVAAFQASDAVNFLVKLQGS